MENKNPIFPLLGMSVVFFMTFLLYHYSNAARGKGYLDNIYLGLEIAVLICHLMNFLVIVFGSKRLEQVPLIASLIAPSSLVNLRDLKHARNFKLQRLTKNALDIVRSNTNHPKENVHSNFSYKLFRFACLEQVTEKAGGLFWAWKCIWNCQFATQEGVMFSSRLVSSNITQYTVVLYICIAAIQMERLWSKLYHQEDT